MATSDNEFKTNITADPANFEAGMRAAAKAAATASADIQKQFRSIGDVVGNITKAFAGATAVLAGGALFKELIGATVSWNAEALKLSKQLGITTEQASVLNVALHHLGIESSVYTDASMKLSKQIQTNAQAFDVMGIKVRDATGAYRPVTELMQEVNEKLAAIKNPIEQNIAGQQVYGKGWAEVRAILKLTSAAMVEAEQRARELGLIVGPEGAAMSKKYTEQMRDLELVGKSVEMTFGNQLLPVFMKTGKWLGEEGPAMGKVFATILDTITTAGEMLWLTLKDMGDGIGAIAAQAAALLRGDLAGFKQIGKERDEEVAKNEKAFERVKAMLFGTAPPAAAPDYSNEGRGHPAKDPQYHFKEKSEAAAPSRMAEWEAMLAQRKAALEREGLLEGQYREMSKADELKYWEDIKSIQGLSDTERIAVARKTAETEMSLIKQSFDIKVATLQAEAAAYKNNTDKRLALELEIQSKYQEGTKEYEESQKRIVEIQRQAAEQEKQIRESRLQAERDARLQTIALEEQTTSAAVQLGLITQAQLLAGQEQFENRRTAIAREALTDRLTLAENDPDRNPVEVEKIHREIEALEQQHALRMSGIRQQQVQNTLQPVLDTLSTIQSSWSNLLQQLATGTLSLGGFIRGLFVSVGQAVIGTLSDIAAKWAVNAILSKIISKTTAASEIVANAGVAGAAATASAAAIPVYGWALAPEAGAAAFAAAMSFLPSISAAGGFDIGGNINPIIQAHAREMVLPAKHADVIRDIADGGGGRGDVNVNIKAHRMPGNYFMVHQDELVAAMKAARRRFAF
ncbi:MAG TPA: hypothetical protein VGI48_09535 [Caldimonas sp.]